MNKLSYGLLSLLSIEPMTGYDLTLRINKFWRSTHSAIYPALSKLEEKGCVKLTVEKQNGKPDKKIYSLTDEGKTVLHDWFVSKTSEEVTRDEMTLKVYCINSMGTEAAEKLLDELETRCNKRIEEYKNLIETFRLNSSENITSSSFGAYILIQRRLNEAILNLKWCEWVKNLYKNKNTNFFNEDFN